MSPPGWLRAHVNLSWFGHACLTQVDLQVYDRVERPSRRDTGEWKVLK